MRDAAEDGLREGNPADRTRSPRVDAHGAHEMMFLTPHEFDVLRGHAKSDVRDLITVLAGTGPRWSEVSALQVRHVDLLAPTPALTVARAWKRTPGAGLDLGRPKSRQSRRTVSLAPQVVDALVEHVAGRDPEEFVVVGGRGAAWSHSRFYDRRWQPATASAAAALGRRPRIHDFRQTHCAWLIAAGVPLPAIQRRLGHSSITTTIDRYGHLLPSLDAALVSAVGAALQPDGPRSPSDELLPSS